MAIINEKKLNLGSYGVSTKGITVAGSTKAYKTIAERDADKNSSMFAFVQDASADPTVKTGFAIYYKKSNGWKKVFEEEAMDQDISVLVTLQWSNLIGGPTSAPADIDDAVVKAHNHLNKDVLDRIGASEDYLTYDGNAAKAKPIRYTKWLQLVKPISATTNIHCTISFYKDPELQDIVTAIDTLHSKDKFKYFDGTKFVQLNDENPVIPTGNVGRFVIVNVENIIKEESLFIQWKWTTAGPANELEHPDKQVLSNGLCVYPSITPTSAESVGLNSVVDTVVWQKLS